MIKNKRGFTFIEIVIALAIISVILIAVTGTMMDSFKAKNRIVYSDTIQQNGSFVVMELRKHVLNSVPEKIVCSGDSIELTNKKNAETTTLVCVDGTLGHIASVSATRDVRLTSDDVSLNNCGNFVSCEPVGGPYSKVTFNFTLIPENTDPGVAGAVQKDFSTVVSVRN